jgi:hypothetical protein
MEYGFMSTISQATFPVPAFTDLTSARASVEAQWLQSQNMMTARLAPEMSARPPAYTGGQQEAINAAKAGNPSEEYTILFDLFDTQALPIANVDVALQHFGKIADTFPVGSSEFLRATQEPVIVPDGYADQLLNVGEDILLLDAEHTFLDSNTRELLETAVNTLPTSSELTHDDKVAQMTYVLGRITQEETDLINDRGYYTTNENKYKEYVTVAHNTLRGLFIDKITEAGILDKLEASVSKINDVDLRDQFNTTLKEIKNVLDSTYSERVPSYVDSRLGNGYDNQEMVQDLQSIEQAIKDMNDTLGENNVPTVDLTPFDQIIKKYQQQSLPTDS